MSKPADPRTKIAALLAKALDSEAGKKRLARLRERLEVYPSQAKLADVEMRQRARRIAAKMPVPGEAEKRFEEKE